MLGPFFFIWPQLKHFQHTYFGPFCFRPYFRKFTTLSTFFYVVLINQHYHGTSTSILHMCFLTFPIQDKNSSSYNSFFCSTLSRFKYPTLSKKKTFPHTFCLFLLSNQNFELTVLIFHLIIFQSSNSQEKQKTKNSVLLLHNKNNNNKLIFYHDCWLLGA